MIGQIDTPKGEESALSFSHIGIIAQSSPDMPSLPYIFSPRRSKFGEV
jgi:hypothetical protein